MLPLLKKIYIGETLYSVRADVLYAFVCVLYPWSERR